jgi:hypothetical protein
MSDTIELQGCEHCGKETDISKMHSMADCWFCSDCLEHWQKCFDTCEHKWSPHTDSMGDHGQVCENCSGFVFDQHFDDLFGPGALAALNAEESQ